MESLTDGRTTNAVVHRLSTIERVDRVAVFARGRVGTREARAELRSPDGRYAKRSCIHIQFATAGAVA